MGTNTGHVLIAGPRKPPWGACCENIPVTVRETSSHLNVSQKGDSPVLGGEFHWRILPNVSRIHTNSPVSSRK